MAEQEFTTEELQSEEWRDIVGYESLYEISSLGRCRRIGAAQGAKVGRILRSHINRRTGYVGIVLCKNCKRHTYRLNVLVATAFFGPCPVGHEVNHKDGRKPNNRSNNLEYQTHQQNQQHASALGLMATGSRHGSQTCPNASPRGEAHPFAKLTDALVRELRLSTESNKDAGIRLGIATNSVRRIRLGERWKHLK